MKQPDFSTFPVLETDRLILRRLTLTDALEIYQLRSDANVAVLTGKAPFVHIDEAIAYINKIDNFVSKDESIFWAVSYKGAPNMIGAVCMWDFDIPSGTVEIGYELLPQFQHKGIMIEAVTRALGYAFEVMGVETVVAFTVSGNPPSVKLLEKAGFILSTDRYQESFAGAPALLTYILTSKA
ncbi:GNAT family N-acetyltransferase [Pedobacter miscanthi]|uniref:GNAT family N-acetyltransferase n=1 Tax=Pedobacter miscanthi TaxID=2259170 RepID=UPI002930FA80|nr:GNAT family N-acetyltransferase [Pedobacter miscanthi]